MSVAAVSMTRTLHWVTPGNRSRPVIIHSRNLIQRKIPYFLQTPAVALDFLVIGLLGSSNVTLFTLSKTK